MGAELRYGKTPSGVINPIEWEEHAEVSGVAGKKVFNVDSSGNIVNPATSANQTSQVALETTLNSLVETLQELAQRLAPLGGAMSNTAQLRAVVTGAVTATGGGYITSAQMVAALLTHSNSLILNDKLFLNNIVAMNSNINNVAIT